MSTDEYRPQVRVTVTPQKVHKGQMISIQADIFDRRTREPMAFDTVYLEVLNEKGVPVWPLTLVENDTATISKLISTADMDAGSDYTVRVTPSKSLRPMGEATFRITDRLLSPALLAPGLALIPDILLRHPKPEDTIQPPPEPPTIAWLIYVTQRDSRVCRICSPDDGRRFRPNDPDLILIPRHINCRCHYDVISHREEKEIFEAYYLARLQEQYREEDALNAYLSVRIAKKHGIQGHQ